MLFVSKVLMASESHMDYSLVGSALLGHTLNVPLMAWVVEE